MLRKTLIMENEIVSIRDLHYENGNIIGIHYPLFLTKIMPEFNQYIHNCIALHWFPIVHHNRGLVTEYIASKLKNKETRIFFDNIYEGNTESCYIAIHEIINELGLDAEKCYLINGGMQLREFYEQYCNENNITKRINLIIINYWERHALYTFRDSNLNYSPKHHIKNKEKLFLCFNRITRMHRVVLLGLLYHKGLVDRSYYSFFHNLSYKNSEMDLFKFLNVLKLPYKKIVENEINKHYNEFPLLLNNLDSSNTNQVLKSDETYYNNSYFSLVTETFFYKINARKEKYEENSVFFSEKTFKPIICKHPFIMLNRPHALEFLRKLGYKTFHPFINEEYDTIQNDSDRLLAIVAEVERLSKQSDQQWLDWLNNVSDIVEYNHSLIMSKQNTDFIFKG